MHFVVELNIVSKEEMDARQVDSILSKPLINKKHTNKNEIIGSTVVVNIQAVTVDSGHRVRF